MPLKILISFGFHLKISNDGQDDHEEPKSNLDVNNDKENVKKDWSDESNLKETVDRVPDDAEVSFIS